MSPRALDSVVATGSFEEPPRDYMLSSGAEDDETQDGAGGWKVASLILCGRKVSLKLKRKVYTVVIRQAILYGSQYWPITEAQANRVKVTELRMLRRIPQIEPVKRVEALVVDRLRRMSRPKLRWEDRLKHDMKELLLTDDMTFDTITWRARTKLGG
ncbi:hypothetical protein Tco_0091623 [Tanacetum coccineum]